MNDQTEAPDDTDADRVDSTTAASVERMLDDLGEQATRAALTADGARASLLELDRILARRLAAELLAQGLPRPAIRERLEGTGMSRRSAYRAIAAVEPTGSAASEGSDAAPPARATASEPSMTTATPEKPAETKPTRPALSPRSIKVKVTHLHAPWPAGVTVGAVVQLMAPDVPAWAVGKCQRVDDATPATHVWRPPAQARDEAPEFPDLLPRGQAAEHEARVTALRDRRDRVAHELAEAQARAAAAAAARHIANTVDGGMPGQVTGVVPAAAAQQLAVDAASRELKAAEAAVRQLDTERQRLDRELADAERLASAEQRLQPAKEAHAAALVALQAADDRVLALDGALGRLDRDIEAEQAVVLSARRAASAALLDRAASGDSRDDVKMPDESRLNALRQARADGDGALASAKAAADKARAAVREAERAVWCVVADYHQPDVEAAQAALLEVATRWARAYGRGYAMPAPLPNIRALVLDAMGVR